jgi:hypothetical protein
VFSRLNVNLILFFVQNSNERESIINFVVLFQNIVAKLRIPNCST